MKKAHLNNRFLGKKPYQVNELSLRVKIGKIVGVVHIAIFFVLPRI
jgi:hypothetical protein